MDDHQSEHPADNDQVQTPATHYGATRMQQMSGGTTTAPFTETDTAGPFGVARIAQLHGIGSDTEADVVRQDDHAAG